jgi:hypothetical protein
MPARTNARGLVVHVMTIHRLRSVRWWRCSTALMIPSKLSGGPTPARSPPSRVADPPPGERRMSVVHSAERIRRQIAIREQAKFLYKTDPRRGQCSCRAGRRTTMGRARFHKSPFPPAWRCPCKQRCRHSLAERLGMTSMSWQPPVPLAHLDPHRPIRYRARPGETTWENPKSGVAWLRERTCSKSERCSRRRSTGAALVAPSGMNPDRSRTASDSDR